jgi:hypothetical protein
LDSIRLSVFELEQIPAEVENDNTLPSVDVLVMKKDPNLNMKVFRKPTHTERYSLSILTTPVT